MSFKIGDRVKLTGFSWGRMPGLNTGDIVTVLAVSASGKSVQFVEGMDNGMLFVTLSPNSAWAVEIVSPDQVVEADNTSTPTQNPRTEGLNQAITLIDGDREGVYGDPLVSHERIGKLWSALLGVEINAHQVAMMMAAMKLSRLAGQAEHKDSWIDLAGYAGLGYEFVVRQGE